MASQLYRNLRELRYDLNEHNKLVTAIKNHTEYIPPEYTPLEYIQATGGQYINFGVPLWSYSCWSVDVTINLSSLYDYQHILSVNDSDTRHETWIDSAGKYYVRLKDGAKIHVATFAPNVKYKLLHEYNAGNHHMYVDGVLRNTYNYGTFNLSDNLRFGKRSDYYFRGKIYAMQLYKDYVMIQDLVPARLNATGEIGLWDRLNNRFVKNAGSGTFVAGPEYK